MSTPAMRFTSSPPRCCAVPGLEEATRICPDSVFSSAISSPKLFTGIAGWTTNTYGVLPIRPTGAKSLLGRRAGWRRARARCRSVLGTRISVWPSGAAFATAPGADGAARAGPVLDHERLAGLLGELLRHEPADHVGGAARREADQDFTGWLG